METQEKLRTNVNAEYDMQKIIEALKEIEVVDYPGVQPYRDATITLTELKLSEVQPMALYIVQRALARQFAIRTDLMRIGHDSLHLNRSLHITHDGTDVNLIPPIVEETNEGLCLMDGLHRSMMAHSLGEATIHALHIQNIDPDYPLTSYPNRWDEIRMYDATPADRSLKKNYRPGGHFFRDLSRLNGSKRREACDAT